MIACTWFAPLAQLFACCENLRARAGQSARAQKSPQPLVTRGGGQGTLRDPWLTSMDRVECHLLVSSPT